MKAGRPRGPRKAFKKVGGEAPHLFEGLVGLPGPARPQKRTPKDPARLPSGTQVQYHLHNGPRRAPKCPRMRLRTKISGADFWRNLHYFSSRGRSRISRGPQGVENRPKTRGTIYHFILPKVCPDGPRRAPQLVLPSLLGGPLAGTQPIEKLFSKLDFWRSIREPHEFRWVAKPPT